MFQLTQIHPLRETYDLRIRLVGIRNGNVESLLNRVAGNETLRLCGLPTLVFIGVAT